ALQVKLGGEGTRVLAKKPTENPEAHRLYLLGRYEFAKYTQAGWNNAIRYYEQALKLDPNYALAYCGLADNYAYMGSVVMPEKEAIAKEKEFAQKALELDPELAEAHMSIALALIGAFDWQNGLKEFDRALELNPKDRKSTRLNSSHVKISYAVFCLKKKKKKYKKYDNKS